MTPDPAGRRHGGALAEPPTGRSLLSLHPRLKDPDCTDFWLRKKTEYFLSAERVGNETEDFPLSGSGTQEP